MNDVDHPVVAQWLRVAGSFCDARLLRASGRRRAFGGCTRYEVDTVDVSARACFARPDRLFWRTNDWLQVHSLGQLLHHARSSGFDPDVLHGHFAAASRSLAATGRKLGIPVVISEHSSALTGGNAAKPMTRVRFEATKRAYEAAQLVLPVSQFLADRIRDAGFVTPLAVVPNPIDTKRFFPSETCDPNRIIVAGRLDPVKRLDLALRALAMVRGDRPMTTLVFAGLGPERSRLEQVAAELGLAGSVTFAGGLTPDALAGEMRRAAVLLSASVVETFGVVAAEALSAGCRVVVTPDTAISELAPEPHVFVAQGSTPRMIADALVQALSLPNVDRQQRHDHVHERYSIEAVASRLSEIYRCVTSAVV